MDPDSDCVEIEFLSSEPARKLPPDCADELNPKTQKFPSELERKNQTHACRFKDELPPIHTASVCAAKRRQGALRRGAISFHSSQSCSFHRTCCSVSQKCVRSATVLQIRVGFIFKSIVSTIDEIAPNRKLNAHYSIATR